ncbi:MAG: hypothetical protein JXB88_10215 [Spirochaetales bacterium]|nr:hypothetical protein [Spirochaetales bacterium]
MIFLFYTRLLLYLLVFCIPFFHPAVVVPYDTQAWWFWFIILPLEMHIAHFLSPPKLKFRYWILCALAPLLLYTLFLSGINLESLISAVICIFAFISTVLIFKTRAKGQIFAVLEIFLLSLLYYKIIGFSRASEYIARKSENVTQVIIIISVLAFLFHAVVLYLSTYKMRIKTDKRMGKEIALFAGIALPLLLIFSLFLPADFVKNSMVFNQLGGEVKPKPIPSNEQGGQLKDGNLDNGGGFEGIPSELWQLTGEESSSSNRQYAVMVIASKKDPVYAASRYLGKIDETMGFTETPGEELNTLTYLRLLETWEAGQENLDAERDLFDMFCISTIPEKVLPYKPVTLEPTIFNKRYYPFNYSYKSSSLISGAEMDDLIKARELDDQEKKLLKQYMEIPMEQSLLDDFKGYLDEIIKEESTGFEKIIDILKSFETYQYRISGRDRPSLLRLHDFLFATRTGDCTEFSHMTALLARLEGIPSRVVEGYLGAKELQTTDHRSALFYLTSKIEMLSSYPFQDLILITTAHKHSWTQVYVPVYGWIDIESTAFAIPPPPGMDLNQRKIIVPILNPEEEEPPVSSFPWQFVLIALGIITSAIIAGLYIFRYSKEFYLWIVSRKNNIKGIKALFKLLLMRYASYGYELKPYWQTSMEYAEKYNELKGFAGLYTRIRYNRVHNDHQKAELRTMYHSLIKKGKKPGLLAGIKKLFTLRGLYY